ncbi:uncharacterized protein LOC132752346 [Ruditapes philippinarum]|uniref:uncharacterized protein LOC132752346 n=1 Tax=Ruditapes philippinarum TaxID=129788 RepID=UPI00295BD469|nr:uncharacterized protein LOC132752346 [Ruditapes philippinarum]
MVYHEQPVTMATNMEYTGDLDIKSEENSVNCLDCLNPNKDKEDFFTAIAIILMSFGLAIMVVGIVVPRDFVFNPSLPAREMESIEIHYANLSFYLDLVAVIGMGFITLGGVISSGVFMYHFIIGSRQVYRKDDRQDINLLDGTNREMVSYGTSESR